MLRKRYFLVMLAVAAVGLGLRWGTAAPSDPIEELMGLRRTLRTGAPASPLYTSPVLGRGQEPHHVSVDVSGVELLFLTAVGVPHIGGSHSAWGEPELIDAGGTRTRITGMNPVFSGVGWSSLRNEGANQLPMGTRNFAHGIFAHSHSVAVYRLDRKYRRFESYVGITTRDKTATGRARFEVWATVPPVADLLKFKVTGLSSDAQAFASQLDLNWGRWLAASDATVEKEYLQRAVAALGENGANLAVRVEDLLRRNPPAQSPEWLRLCLDARRQRTDAEACARLLQMASDGMVPVLDPGLTAAYQARKQSLQKVAPQVLREDPSKLHASLDAEVKLQAKLGLAKRTLEYVQQSRALPDLARQLVAFERRYANTTGILPPAMLEEISDLRRQVIFAHPALNFEKILICKNPPTTYSHNCDQYQGRHSRVGEGLAILENWKTTPRVKLLLKGKLPPGAYAKPDLSYDAKRVVFAFADHTPQDATRRRFFLYEAATDGSWVRQLTGTARDPLTGWMGRRSVLIEDNDPCYLPDGGIAFVSSRSQNFGRCHGGRYTPAFLLFRCDADGNNIRQLSWGEGNENDPSVLDDGRIIYTRWEYVDRHEMEFHKLWWTRPDGTAVSNFYGNDTIYPLMIAEARAVPGTGKVVATAMAHHSFTTGTTILIDPRRGENGPDPITRITPEIRFPEGEVSFNTGGSYSSPYPLNEELYLAAYSDEDIAPQGKVPSPNRFAIYLVDRLGGRELIYRDPNMSSFAPIPLVPRKAPPVLPSMLPAKPESQTGVYLIQNVALTRNDPEGLIKPGEIRALRFNELINKPAAINGAVSQPVGVAMPKRILGTVPVDEYGSVAVRVPAGIPLQIQALDKNGMAILTERSFHYVQPGEVRSCVGCHERSSAAPPTGGRGWSTMKPKELTPPAGPRYEGGLSFARTVQPVLDRYCIGCHGLGSRREGGVNLVGSPAGAYSQSYLALVARTVAIGLKEQTHGLAKNISRPRDYYAHGGKLGKMLLANHSNVNLDRAGFSRIVDWLDMNGQAYGDYSRNRVENRRPHPAGEKALREYVRERFGEEMANAPYAALVNVGQPDESRILMAPLAAKAGGWGQIEKNGWASTKDAAYLKMRQLVEGAIAPLTRLDVAGTCGSHQYGGPCSCGCCWVPKAEAEYRALLAKPTAR